MNLYHADYEISTANRRIEDMRLEIANNRIASAITARQGAPRGFRAAALFDAAVARASQGAVRRHSARTGRQTPPPTPRPPPNPTPQPPPGGAPTQPNTPTAQPNRKRTQPPNHTACHHPKQPEQPPKKVPPPEKRATRDTNPVTHARKDHTQHSALAEANPSRPQERARRSGGFAAYRSP